MPPDKAMKRRAMAHARLANLTSLVWVFFCVTTGLALIIMPAQIGETFIRENLTHQILAETLVHVVKSLDAVWIVLAALSVYLFMVTHLSLPTARMWAVIIIVLSGMVFYLGAKTGYPFGPISYTDNMGGRLFGVIPFTLPLLWLVIVVGGRFLVLKVFPTANRWQTALATGGVALLMSFNLEMIAWKVRAYWIWYPGPVLPTPEWPPLQNFMAWFILAAVLCVVLPTSRQKPETSATWKPILVLTMLNAVFLAMHLVFFLRYTVFAG